MVTIEDIEKKELMRKILESDKEGFWKRATDVWNEKTQFDKMTFIHQVRYKLKHDVLKEIAHIRNQLVYKNYLDITNPKKTKYTPSSGKISRQEISERVLKQMIYVNGDGLECVDWCDSCQNIVTQTEINGSFCCEYCHSENINILEVR